MECIKIGQEIFDFYEKKYGGSAPGAKKALDHVCAKIRERCKGDADQRILFIQLAWDCQVKSRSGYLCRFPRSVEKALFISEALKIH